ncbi:hypothetical protein [Actinomadura sp. DC4]|uniref:hypothetical protein n=1 Tax=Actinomadura sp. DC4 TaxID=3055069 RepID=UPI0025AF79D6|nr:hypothetical protein [Actinomadura sp. DC4]MDN3359296.1 hypothetical protein [Actinomadura sp. DC4]
MSIAADRPAGEGADGVVRRLDYALRREGLATEILEPATKIKVYAPNGNPVFDEVLTLKQGDNEIFTWWWSWDAPQGSAHDIVATVSAVKSVVS